MLRTVRFMTSDEAVPTSTEAPARPVNHVFFMLVRTTPLRHLQDLSWINLDEIDGQRYEDFPSNARQFARCQPIYKTLPGWNQSTADCRSLDDLPRKALDYLKYLAELMEVPIAIVSLGASRDQTIIVEDPIHGPKRALLYTNGTPAPAEV